jgi:hypothetical protein
MAITSPSLAVEFARLSSRCQEFRYGPHSMHAIHMFVPNEDDYTGLPVCEPSGLLFFVVSPVIVTEWSACDCLNGC